MGYARYVGRVGALAVALGVGAAVAGAPGIALADDNDPPSSSSDSPGAESPNDAPNEPPSAPPTPSTDGTGEDGETPSISSATETPSTPHTPRARVGSAWQSELVQRTVSALQVVVRDSVDRARKAADEAVERSRNTLPRNDSPGVEDGTEAKDAPKSAPNDTPQQDPAADDASALRAVPTIVNAPTIDVPKLTAPKLILPKVDLPTITTPTINTASAITHVSRVPEPRELPSVTTNVISTLVAAVIGPLAGQGPHAPAPPPILWTVLAAVHRELERFQRTFFNHTPDVRPQRVTVELDEPDDVSDPIAFDARDRDGDELTYSVPQRGEPRGPQHGTVTIDQATGEFTYDPDDEFAITGGKDSFVVTVSDHDDAEFHLHGLASLFGWGRPHRDSARVEITVTPTPVPAVGPDATDDAYATDEDTPLTVPASTGVLANDTDPDTDPADLITTVANGPASGTLTLNPNGSFTYTPNANFAGADSFSYTVSDGTSSDTATVNITVNSVNDPVTAINDNATTDEDTAVTIDVLANDQVADGGAVVTIVDPGQGTATVVDGKIRYTPNANVTGLQKVTYRVTDADGSTATAVVNITVNPVDDPVTAADDTATVDEDGEVTIDVLANDTYPDRGQTVVVTAPPTNGTATVVGGKIVYRPAANTSGTDTFTYTLTDQDGSTAEATVAITVNPVDDDVTAIDDTASTDEDTAVTIDVLANDLVPDGGATLAAVTYSADIGSVQMVDNKIVYTPAPNVHGTQTISYIVVDADGDTAIGNVEVTVNSIDDPLIANTDHLTVGEDTTGTVNILANDSYADGLASVTVTPPARGTATYDAATGVLTYKPYPNVNGSDTVTYTLTDADGDVVTGTVVVTITPADDPVIANDDTATTNEGTAVTINVLANDQYPDGSPAVTVAPLSSTALGTVAVLSNGTITFTPYANASGTQVLTHSLKDVDGSVDTATVTITVVSVDDVPVAIADTATTNEDTPVTIAVLANDIVDDGPGTVISAVANPAQGTAVINANGSITYTPKANTFGVQQFTYTVRDVDGDTSTTIVTVTVNPRNDAPSADPSYGAANDYGAMTGDINGSDIDGDTLSYSVDTAPTRGTLELDEATGEFTYTPDLAEQLRARTEPATDSFVVMVNDGNGGEVPVTVTIGVPPATATVTTTITTGIGDGPYGVVTHPTQPRVYVVNENSNSVSVIDTSTNSVIATIPAGSGPAGVAIAADGSRLYVTNEDSDNVTVINTVTNQVVATVSVGDAPARAVVAPNGYLYVANFGSNTISVIDTATNSPVDLSPSRRPEHHHGGQRPARPGHVARRHPPLRGQPGQ